jgi:RNA polymerase sigma-70 factor (family 1)
MAHDERLASLCLRIRNSDREAFAEVFADFRPALLRYVDGMVGDGMAAHDLVQDVFLSLWDRRHRLDPSLSLKALLYRMARNRSFKHLRARRVRLRHVATLPPLTPTFDAPDLDGKDLSERMRRWINALPERQREALRLTRFEGLTHQETAEVMEISARTVNNHLVRALSTLSDRLAALETVPEMGYRDAT